MAFDTAILKNHDDAGYENRQIYENYDAVDAHFWFLVMCPSLAIQFPSLAVCQSFKHSYDDEIQIPDECENLDDDDDFIPF